MPHTAELTHAQLEKMAQLYRFVEFGRLSSGVFHDLLNPLTTVLLAIEHIQSELVDKSTESAAQLERAMRASQRIKDFIQTARKQLDTSHGLRSFAVEHEVRDAMDLLLHKSLKAGVEIKARLDPDISIRGNPVKFFQIAVNLISNAIDSYEDTEKAARRKILVSVEIQNSKSLIFKVQDFGCGIPKRSLKKIFEHFYTTKPKHAGMGLGLSATKSMVETDFGGTIVVESMSGKGSTFTVNIPTKDAFARSR